MNFSTKSIVAAVLILSSFALGYFAVWPKWNDYSAAKLQLDAALDQEKSLQVARDQMNAFLTEYRTHTEEAKRLNQSLPLSSSEMHNVLNNLDTLTRSSGLTLGVLSFVDAPQADDLGAPPHSIRPVQISLNGSGSYAAIKNFLISLESNLRLIDINSITLNEAENSMIFTMTFTTYYQY
ncbi:MAG: type 4a pilus biogenesis protein PilO [Candidatus Doudnabacteria bacterium]|nr:type 4a pilus biogenesis protein PilO [Candidatus Doudnabacteria bacterium]